MALVPDRGGGREDEGAANDDCQKGEAEEEEGALGHQGAVAGAEGVGFGGAAELFGAEGHFEWYFCRE